MVRSYKPSDAVAIAALLESVKHRTSFPDQSACPITLGKMLDQLCHMPNAVIYVAERRGKLVGVLAAVEFHRLWSEKNRVAEDLLFVSVGSGRELLEAYKDWARALGVEQIVTHCSSGDPRTDKWYESLGAKKLGSIWEIG